MLDPRFILENPELIRKNIAARQMKVDLDRYLELETQRREIQKQIEAVRAEANALAKNNALSVDERRAKGQQLKKDEVAIQEKLGPLETEAMAIYMQIPNLTYEGSPVGDEAAGEDIARGKTPIREFDFPVRDHIDLMESHRILDLNAGAKVAGSGWYYLMGNGALLQMALTRFGMDMAIKAGYTPVITPDVARDSVMQGAGFVPRGNESNTYRLEDSDLNLIATSEISLVGMMADETLAAAELPVKLAGLSHCFRSERAHGSATRGIYRVHQFTKVEMVAVCAPEDGEKVHFEMRKVEQDVFDALEIPYRVIEIATGDLGAPAYRKFDLEAWMPGRAGKGDWGEITSTSNCTDFQARRLNIKYKDGSGKNKFAYTLNGTAISLCRAIVALVENHQTKDGDIMIPKALQPYMNGVTKLERGKR